MHKRASIYGDPVHKAVWQKHPAREKGNYPCAKCHTPADTSLIRDKGLPAPNPTQLHEPISCQTCHTIQDIQEHAKSNTNIYADTPKTFFTADLSRKGEKLIFHESSRFFGLLRTTVGSPYHDIDYSNENFYTGRVCLGCHDHKQNSKSFTICDMQIKHDPKHKETCISCHMPQIKGSFANQRQTQTHAYHGSNIVTASPAMLQKHIDITVDKTPGGFTVTIENRASHTLFPHPLRLSLLKVSVRKADRQIRTNPRLFQRIIGKEGKPTPPWLAESVLTDTTIKAFEKRKITYTIPLEKGDIVEAELGYHIVNPKMAEKLGITQTHYTRYIPFKKVRISF